MKSIKNVIILGGLFACTLFGSCVDAELESVVEYKNHYKTLDDANSAILGLYGKFMGLAEQTIVLGELRADLMDVTDNASIELQEINTNTPSSGNKYADMTNYYSVIQNCNDILAGFEDMLANNRLTQEEYSELYSDVAALRCWTYLQVGMYFGKAVYVTEPTVSVEDASKLEQLPKIGLDELLPRLIECMENLPTLEDYLNSDLIKYKLDTYDLKRFFVNKRILLGDLYLWNGNYREAAVQYRKFLSTDENKASTANAVRYRCGSYSTGGDTYFQVFYERYMDGDMNSYKNTWLNMFAFPADKSALWSELIWTISYDPAFEPYYPLIELFANEGKGKYELMPSAYAVTDLWEKEEQKNGAEFDGRGRDSSYKLVNGEYVVQKYLYDYDPVKPYEKKGRWFLNRAAQVLLRYAEAVNRCGYTKLAYSILNEGFKTTYRYTPESEAKREWDCVTSYEYGQPYPEPFYFDARSIDAPYYRSPWREFTGIRGRVSLKAKEMEPEAGETDVQCMEKLLIEESALELAFEGHRWGDLIRVARRMNKEKAGSGSEYLKEVIGRKYERSGLSVPDFSSEEKWYLNVSK
ncbi:RagB/SusD family nutrient uptake outer membrane protein [Bacteroides finegoldii]|jgi:hypothetical protein|uniref:RagB/SusD family nutrient uptake outer membrane protein n=1 Tax=Bacteroides finegoldii TaxID=338188 RepID=UPI00234C4D46|nr:RagB/SusD family nutrient uptake outer membrane protein [Bacteroides finegoldii]MDC7139353.1 RagB/SusD family nutrient uptake outer membrane protein [Bacteroides finegoldii]